eukprot:464106_1
MNRIIFSPPKHEQAIDTKIPIHYLLSLQNNNIINDENNYKNDIINVENRSETMKNILKNDENDKIKRSQIKRVSKIDIIDNKSLIPEQINIYRNKLLHMFDTREYCSYIAAFIYIIIKDESISNELFIKIIKPLPFIECIINTLSNDKIFMDLNLNIFPIRILIELLIYFQKHYKNILNEKHYKLLREIYNNITNKLSQYCIQFISNDETMK